MTSGDHRSSEIACKVSLRPLGTQLPCVAARRPDRSLGEGEALNWHEKTRLLPSSPPRASQQQQIQIRQAYNVIRSFIEGGEQSGMKVNYLKNNPFFLKKHYIYIVILQMLLSKATYNWGIHKVINLEEANRQSKCP